MLVTIKPNINIKFEWFFHANPTNNAINTHIWIIDTVLKRTVGFPRCKDVETDGVRGDQGSQREGEGQEHHEEGHGGRQPAGD